MNLARVRPFMLVSTPRAVVDTRVLSCRGKPQREIRGRGAEEGREERKKKREKERERNIVRARCHTLELIKCV